MRTVDLFCDHCGADPGEPCETSAKKERRGFHRARHDRASEVAAAELRKKAREEEESRKRELALALAEPVPSMEAVYRFLKENLRLGTDSQITCPEEGMPEDVYVTLLLAGEEIDRVQL